MNDRTMVKMRVSEDYIIFRTITKSKKSSEFYVRRSELTALEYTDQIIAWDCSFAVFTRDSEARTVSIRFYWMNMSDTGSFTGRRQDVTLPFKPFMDFVKWSVFEEQPQKWSALSIEPRFSPKLTFVSTRNLHAALADKLTRRKLSKFLRNNFHWRDSTEIIFTDDFIPRSFFFREMRKNTAGMCGGLILHGQENMAKAYYSIHT